MSENVQFDLIDKSMLNYVLELFKTHESIFLITLAYRMNVIGWDIATVDFPKAKIDR